MLRGQIRCPQVGQGDRKLDLGESSLVVTQRRPLDQSAGDERDGAVDFAECDEDERASTNGPTGEQVQVFGESKRALECVECLVELPSCPAA